MAIVTITPKGQVMIPAALRKQCGIKPGRKVSIELEGDALLIRPLPEDPVDALYGILSWTSPATPAAEE
jgi:antitoxin PrlF